MQNDSEFLWLRTLARQAGDAILNVYETEFEVADKSDSSPVTLADLRADQVIRKGLSVRDPQIPMISEEAEIPPFEQRRRWSRYWLIDPLDGTREFISRNGEFTVNIALIENHEPVLGVVHVPVSNTTYWGGRKLGAFRQVGDANPESISVRQSVNSPIDVVVSRSHRTAAVDAWLMRLGAHSLQNVGSSIKLCTVAEGNADVYPRFGPTSEWDIAAAHAVVNGAGGTVATWDGQTLAYNSKPDMLNGDFIVFGSDERDWLNL